MKPRLLCNEKPRDVSRDFLNAQAQPPTAEHPSAAKAGIKLRSGLRAGYRQMSFTEMY